MFDQLSDRLQSTLSDVRSRGKLSEGDIDSAMRDIRLALLEADVNFKVVKAFIENAERALPGRRGDGQPRSRPAGGQDRQRGARRPDGRDRLELAMANSGPTVILMAGLQGSGKTTACAKLAQFLQASSAKTWRSPPATSTDPPRSSSWSAGPSGRRPRLRRKAPTPIRSTSRPGRSTVPARSGATSLIIDTAGRLHIDEELMEELSRIRDKTKPHDVLLVVDAMTGQDAVEVAECVRRGGRVRRRRPDQARRRRPRRRRALGQSGHRQADHVRLDRRENRGLRASSTRTAWRSGSSAWATCSA